MLSRRSKKRKCHISNTTKSKNILVWFACNGIITSFLYNLDHAVSINGHKNIFIVICSQQNKLFGVNSLRM